MSGRSRDAAALATTPGTGRTRLVPVDVSAVSWWYVSWRGRVLEESTGDAEVRLSMVLDAMEQLGPVGRRPTMRVLGVRQVVFEFWFEAMGTREAAGGARVALRQGFRAARVGDPTPPTGAGPVDVMVMLEELPMLLRDQS
jgi:hypothetical protein